MDLLDNNIHTIQIGRKIWWCFFKFMDVDHFSYYFSMTKTPNKSNYKYEISYLNQYSSFKIYQRIKGTMIYILYKIGGKYCSNYSYLLS